MSFTNACDIIRGEKILEIICEVDYEYLLYEAKEKFMDTGMTRQEAIT
ncbi:MAG: hypothetical protein MSG78_07810 [Clostridiales bacterium]|nr:hypothetical protein [Clostridiales bacterium]